MTELNPKVRDNNLAQQEIALRLGLFTRIDLTIPAQRRVANSVRVNLGLSELPRSDEHSSEVQHLSGLSDARNERVADGDVSKYADGATELMTQQTQPATEELTAPRLGNQLRQKGAE